MIAWLRERWYWLAAILASILAAILATILANRRRAPADQLEADLRVLDDTVRQRTAAAGEVRTATRRAVEAEHGQAEAALGAQAETRARELAEGPPAELSAYLDDVDRRNR